jgi:hypothetical protein
VDKDNHGTHVAGAYKECLTVLRTVLEKFVNYKEFAVLVLLESRNN